MAVFKNSAVWTMSTETLVEHLSNIAAPDQVYWDSRSLKLDGQKFQKLDWSHWPKPAKVDGAWAFAPAPAPAPAPTPVPLPAAPAPAPASAPTPAPATLADEATLRTALAAIPGDDVAAWVIGGCAHPAPEAITHVKIACGGGWTQVQRVARSLA